MKTINSLILLLLPTLLFSQSITTEDTTSWYKTQVGTGVDNCGPVVIAMLVERSGPATSVQQIRNQLPEGSADYDDLLEVLDNYRIKFYYLKNLDEWSGEGVVMLLFNPSLVPEVPYDYDGGHYILLTGKRGSNYIVNDSLASMPGLYYPEEAVRRARYRYIIWIP